MIAVRCTIADIIMPRDSGQMPIEIKCTHCGATLRVADEHAGKNARCPECATVVPIPSATPGFPPSRSGPTGPDSPDVDTTSSPTPSAPNPFASPMTETPMAEGGAEPHRGPLILGLGIGGLFCCVILSIVAIVMANEDLKKMSAGQMDPTGRGLTSAGRIVGIISIVLTVLSVILQIVLVVAQEM